MITVRDLIEKLKSFPEDMEVKYEDMEDGDTEINEVSLSEIPNKNDYVSLSWWKRVG